jgi:hypothetical protein
MVRSAGERAPLWGPILVLGVVLGAGLGAGCSQAPAPEAAVPEAPAEVASEAPPATADPAEAPVPDPAPAAPAEEPAPPAAAEPDPTVIVIERRDREREAKPRTLYEASVAAREQRAKASPSTVAITDENLHEFQGQGLTFAEAAEGEEAETEGTEEGAVAEADDDAGPAAAGPERDETYWRTRVRDLRLALRQAVDELDEIEERAASLRRSFYAEDDPYVRDAEIKPAWDRALDRISDTRRALTRMRDELAATLEEGRRAGALPGWLREGIELEPLPEELPPPGEGSGTHEPGEPSVIEIGEPPP